MPGPDGETRWMTFSPDSGVTTPARLSRWWRGLMEVHGFAGARQKIKGPKGPGSIEKRKEKSYLTRTSVVLRLVLARPSSRFRCTMRLVMNSVFLPVGRMRSTLL